MVPRRRSSAIGAERQGCRRIRTGCGSAPARSRRRQGHRIDGIASVRETPAGPASCRSRTRGRTELILRAACRHSPWSPHRRRSTTWIDSDMHRGPAGSEPTEVYLRSVTRKRVWIVARIRRQCVGRNRHSAGCALPVAIMAVVCTRFNRFLFRAAGGLRCLWAGRSSAGRSISCWPTRRPGAAARSWCAAKPASARRLSWSICARGPRSPGSASRPPRASKRRRSSPTRVCIRCALPSSTTCPRSRSRSSVLSASRSGETRARRPTGSSSAWPLWVCSPRPRSGAVCCVSSTTRSGWMRHRWMCSRSSRGGSAPNGWPWCSAFATARHGAQSSPACRNSA